MLVKRRLLINLLSSLIVVICRYVITVNKVIVIYKVINTVNNLKTNNHTQNNPFKIKHNHPVNTPTSKATQFVYQSPTSKNFFKCSKPPKNNFNLSMTNSTNVFPASKVSPKAPIFMATVVIEPPTNYTLHTPLMSSSTNFNSLSNSLTIIKNIINNHSSLQN